MTHKQRFRTALARKQPDRLPCGVSFNTSTEGELYNFGGLSAQEKILKYLNTDDYEKVLERLGVDYRSLNPRLLPPDTERKNRLNRIYTSIREAQTIDDLNRLEWPTWDQIWDLSHLREDMEKLLDSKKDYALCSGLTPAMWELAREWRGFNQIMVDWMTDPEFVVKLFEIVYNLYMPANYIYAEQLGNLVNEVDFLYGGSDFGMQDRPMVSPALFERDYEPFVRKEIKELKSIFSNAFYEFHCCGCIIPFLPSMIKAGVECIHPVQPAAKGMDFEYLKENWGDKLAFRGGFDAQSQAAHGTIEDARQLVLHAFGTIGRGGGFIFSPHGIMPEVPVENIVAMFDTIQDECWY